MGSEGWGLRKNGWLRQNNGFLSRSIYMQSPAAKGRDKKKVLIFSSAHVSNPVRKPLKTASSLPMLKGSGIYSLYKL